MERTEVRAPLAPDEFANLTTSHVLQRAAYTAETLNAEGVNLSNLTPTQWAVAITQKMYGRAIDINDTDLWFDVGGYAQKAEQVISQYEFASYSRGPGVLSGHIDRVLFVNHQTKELGIGLAGTNPADPTDLANDLDILSRGPTLSGMATALDLQAIGSTYVGYTAIIGAHSLSSHDLQQASLTKGIDLHFVRFAGAFRAPGFGALDNGSVRGDVVDATTGEFSPYADQFNSTPSIPIVFLQHARDPISNYSSQSLYGSRIYVIPENVDPSRGLSPGTVGAHFTVGDISYLEAPQGDYGDSALNRRLFRHP